jgi:hypothetical protein
MADSYLSPVPISSISRTSSIVSVTTASAHGLAAGQAVVIAGAADTTCNGIFYVQSVGSATTLTYNSAGSNSSGTAGTAGPARQVFALDIQPQSPGLSTLLLAFWYPVSAPVPKASYASAVPTSIPHPPTAAEQAALTAGILVEESLYVTIPASWAQRA